MKKTKTINSGKIIEAEKGIEIEIAYRVASYPEDGNTDDDLLAKLENAQITFPGWPGDAWFDKEGKITPSPTKMYGQIKC